MKKHVHAALIHDWADGAEIQYCGSGKQWVDVPFPAWNPYNKYRIKPYPDVIVKIHVRGSDECCAGFQFNESTESNVEYTFNGFTGKLRSVKLINQ